MARKRGFLVQIQGVKSYRSKGRWYHYDRVTGQRLLAEPGTPEFLAEIQALRSVAREMVLPRGTLGGVIGQFKASESYWDVLKPDTRLSYERAFKVLDVIKTAPMADMTRSAIINLRDDVLRPKYGRWMANYAVTVLGILFQFAHDKGIVKESPLGKKIRKIRKPPGAEKANRRWTEEERRVVLQEAPPHIRLPVAMAMCLGLRYSDIIRATLAALVDGEFAITTRKRDAPIRVPVHPILAEALAQRPKSDAIQICLNSDGKPWKTGFNASWAKFRNRLLSEGKIGKGLTLHGLRHTLGTMLSEAGLDDGKIADVLGQSGIMMARHYSKEAKLAEVTKDAVLGVDWTGRKTNKNV
jgi:integrase